jgi:predicted site-specific integrase-resolvase
MGTIMAKTDNGKLSKLLTAKEAAQMIGIPFNTLTYWRKEGKSPAYMKDGDRVYYKKSVVQEWIAEHSELVSTKQAAQMMGIAPFTLREFVRKNRKEYEVIKWGKDFYFRKSDIEAQAEKRSRLLTAQETADMMGISLTTLNAHRREHKDAPERAEGNNYVKASVEEWVQKRSELLNTREAAEAMGITHQTLKGKLKNRNDLPEHIKENGRIYFAKADIEKWVEERSKLLTVKQAAQVMGISSSHLNKCVRHENIIASEYVVLGGKGYITKTAVKKWIRERHKCST